MTPDLLKKLDTLTQRSPAGLRGAVLLSAAYEAGILARPASRMT